MKWPYARAAHARLSRTLDHPCKMALRVRSPPAAWSCLVRVRPRSQVARDAQEFVGRGSFFLGRLSLPSRTRAYVGILLMVLKLETSRGKSRVGVAVLVRGSRVRVAARASVIHYSTEIVSSTEREKTMKYP